MNRQSFPGRKEIEAALQRVQAGELSPAEATQLLLADVSPQPATRHSAVATHGLDEESLASLINRLGEPPVDVVEAWCRQITQAAITHEQSSGESLPSIDLHDWAISAAGELLWKRQSFPERGFGELDSPELSDESLAQIDRFRRSLLDDESAPSDDSTSRTIPKSQDARLEADSSSRRQPHRSRPPQRLMIGAAVVCLAAVVAVLLKAWGTNAGISGKPAADVPLAFDRMNDVDTLGPDQASTETLGPIDPSSDAVVKLEMFESTREADSVSIDQTDVSMSLDTLVPTSGFLTPPTEGALAISPTATGSAPGDTPAPDRIIGAADTGGDVDAAMDENDSHSPDESPQRTRSRAVTAAPLPAIDEVDAVTELWDRSADSLALAFPLEVPLELSEGDSARVWEILDTRSDVIVANIAASATGTRLTWSDDASSSSLAGSLVHGRLTDQAGSVIYLRPTIETDPWPIQLDQADVRPTWDLRWPIPPRVTRLAIEFELPEEIEAGWIEPIEPAELRRTRGMAVLTSKESETVALAIRFDTRCGRKLSVRIRFAARLAPTMPWQFVSNSSLLQLADQLTEQASAISRQSTQMAALYGRADTSERRVLRPHRDQIDAQAEALRVASQRVAELQAMIDSIQAGGLLKLRVWVTWPDAEQTLLATAAGAEDPSPRESDAAKN